MDTATIKAKFARMGARLKFGELDRRGIGLVSSWSPSNNLPIGLPPAVARPGELRRLRRPLG